MTKNYVFDIGKTEFKDDYSDGELWQDHAKEQLVLNLESILKDAKEYAYFRKNKKDCRDSGNETWLSHNAILVTSQRGSGKTVFLRNSKAMWAESKKDTSELFFLKVIDPTMLMANDSFANVIVAQIYDAVSKKLNKLTCCDDRSKRERDTFHRYLKKLADSMGKTSEFNGSIGIDKILKYSSGIHLEANFHNFVESAIEILGCKAIAVLIDDVDMALDKAFEVVDDVRRFLGCPYIIPVVSGDLKLYEHMTQNHFDEKAYDNKCDNHRLREAGQELSEELTDAYLTKVFPAPMRISLFNVDRLLTKMIIVDEDIKHISFYEYRENIFNQFYHFRHNAEARRNWPELSSAREFTQLVRTLKPSDLNKDVLTTSQEIALYNRLKNWAIQKKSGELLALAETVITLLQNTHTDFDITELLVFNIKAQIDANLYHWAEFEVLQSQAESLGSKKDSANNLRSLESVFKDYARCLQSMPPLEFIFEKLFIGKKVTDKNNNKVDIDSSHVKKIEASNLYRTINPNDLQSGSYRVDDILKDIYTESEMYSTLNNEHHFIFFSRAFELIAFSFRMPKSGMKQLDQIYKIISRKPFYSLIKLAETKVAIDGEEKSNLNSNFNDTLNSTAIALYSMITSWQDMHSALLQNNSLTKLVALLSYSFNGVFTALNIIKGNLSNKLIDENLTDMILRFKYNLLNTIIRAGIYGEAIQANVLVWAQTTTVRSISKINNSERTYTRNYKKLIEEIESCDKGEVAKKVTLLDVKDLHDAVSEHPVFSVFINTDKTVMTMLKVGKAGVDDENEKEVNSELSRPNVPEKKSRSHTIRKPNLSELGKCEVLKKYIDTEYCKDVAFLLQFFHHNTKNINTIRLKIEELSSSGSISGIIIPRLKRIAKAIDMSQIKSWNDESFISNIESPIISNILIVIRNMEDLDA
ncbi:MULTISPECIES: hypothetical protein [unclassified Pseudoalteromonas]|uniref:hypothetical protein n=1 Tax=Pseudoalteromonas sp. RB2-MNA-CIBAN-0110 TaxID=3140439 RepID=UPI000414AAB1|nr:hypothetical protein [Pseudoalteromonas sp. TB13]